MRTCKSNEQHFPNLDVPKCYDEYIRFDTPKNRLQINSNKTQCEHFLSQNPNILNSCAQKTFCCNYPTDDDFMKSFYNCDETCCSSYLCYHSPMSFNDNLSDDPETNLTNIHSHDRFKISPERRMRLCSENKTKVESKIPTISKTIRKGKRIPASRIEKARKMVKKQARNVKKIELKNPTRISSPSRPWSFLSSDSFERKNTLSLNPKSLKGMSPNFSTHISRFGSSKTENIKISKIPSISQCRTSITKRILFPKRYDMKTEMQTSPTTKHNNPNVSLKMRSLTNKTTEEETNRFNADVEMAKELIETVLESISQQQTRPVTIIETDDQHLSVDSPPQSKSPKNFHPFNEFIFGEIMSDEVITQQSHPTANFRHVAETIDTKEFFAENISSVSQFNSPIEPIVTATSSPEAVYYFTSVEPSSSDMRRTETVFGLAKTYGANISTKQEYLTVSKS